MIDKRIKWQGAAEGFEYESISSVTETGTDLFSIPVDSPNAEVNMQNMTKFIQFAGTGTVADGQSVVAYTRELIAYVRFLVKTDFAKFFTA